LLDFVAFGSNFLGRVPRRSANHGRNERVAVGHEVVVGLPIEQLDADGVV
jgi:hypothetical protein